MLIPADPELIRQLTERRIQYDDQARIQLEPKERMRARGLHSPDRPDAIIGAAIGLPPAAHWSPEWRAAQAAERETLLQRMERENARRNRSGIVRFGY